MGDTPERKPLTHAQRGAMSRRAGVSNYPQPEVERGLHALALLGTATRAAEETGIPPTTLTNWRRNVFADRYLEIREQVVPRIHRQMAAETEDLARRYAQTENALLDQFNDQLTRLQPSDTASALRNIGTSRAISTDKALLLRDKPTSIVEHRSPEDILRKLASAGIASIDSTATDLDDEATDA